MSRLTFTSHKHVARCVRAMLVLALVLGYGCKKDRDIEFPPGTNGFVNQWVMDSMNVYYYWNHSLPGAPDYSQEPLDFFTSLKNQEDRFSRLFNPSVQESNTYTMSTRFGFDMVTLQTSAGVKTFVSMVVPGAQAALNGISRGDIVTSLNAVEPDEHNVASLVDGSLKTGAITLTILGRPEPVTINSAARRSIAVYTHQVLEEGAKKTGYVFLNSFEENACDEMMQVFEEFRQEQVNELILDLRYNPGGEVPVSAAIATMIAPVSAEDIFVEFRGNSRLGTLRSSFSYELSKLTNKVSFSALSALRLNISRLFILTGKHTASSAELLANCLAPYITVKRIGETTLGKDMASFRIKDMRVPAEVTGWEIYPIVYKLYNKDARGNYASGLLPDTEINELSVLPLLPFGSAADPLVSAALSQITGRTAKVSSKSYSEAKPAVLYDSGTRTDQTALPAVIRK